MARKIRQICTVDFDYAAYVGDSNDGCYYDVTYGEDGWYTTVTVDCDTAGFVDDLVVDDGPYPTEEEAQQAGRAHAEDWCVTNDVNCDEDDEA